MKRPFAAASCSAWVLALAACSSRNDFLPQPMGAAGTAAAGAPAQPMMPVALAGMPPVMEMPMQPEPTGLVPRSPVPMAPNGFTVSGTDILTASGTPILFHGVNRPSFEWSATGQGELRGEGVYQAIASWGANIVRIPLNQEFWTNDSSGYRGTIQQEVQFAKNNGMAVMLDLHWTSTASEQEEMARPSAVAFWQSVADTFKNDGQVIFDLYNEPHTIDFRVWRDGNAEWAGMQTLYDAVRGQQAHNLVVVSGLQYGYDLFPVMDGLLDHEDRALLAYNTVYATHVYEADGQTNRQPAFWDQFFGNVGQKFPVIIAEFGTIIDGQCHADFENQVMDYADQHGMGWIAWAWFSGGCSFPSLISDWGGTPSVKGQAVRTRMLSY